tara:strand:+ start:118 stop:393 length:276 start_codon:yes stop_codon:yes gene_type:complete
MAIILVSARYGSGRFGLSGYGEEDIVQVLGSVSATGAVSEDITELTLNLGSVTATIVVDISGASVAGVVFNFEAVRDQYSKRRSITIPRAA